ncbi:aerobic glycerol-3-phosphate dehydrogenase [Gracilibacillus boraciitolerans JCM 21714]|uniref:Glycerol-3-phosphate dehydrogenase n=1 Tax=Gracilibacillus boraciitolerans JCM 21714 TaxID=1298598 RepID=W4VFI3_9BACI|nr:FAD-dependent oxidoreductase [Gracilibacillus boraciitolerans]GAE91947.1 aerobic glycerol-3-phosphate dehydrogenase [Gracilibacillus boraciitolerans JCM 21714]
MTFSSEKRIEIYEQIKQEPLDMIVIGGGITGAGIALDAVLRGLKVAVIEMQDFAAGTSSRSTKLVHGGLRYLKQFEVKMVAEVGGKEREIVYENGPHVTVPEWMMLPFYKEGSFGPLSTNVGLRVYDFLAGVKKSERRKMLSKDEALKREPLLKDQDLKGAGYYVEYRTDDARLTLEVMKKAVEKGALALNYAKVNELLYEEGSLTGVQVEDQLTQEIYDIKAKYVVNATGPWVDTIREKDNSKKGKTLQLTKGIHLVFDGSTFPLKQAIYFDTPDGRMVFAIPRNGKTYVGTTDTVYKGNIAHPTMTELDEEYVLKAIDFMFPRLNITKKDVESSWAGLRPLIHEDGKDPSEISRKDEIFESESGLISIAGGKLTGYRKMAEDVVNVIQDKMVKAERKVFYPSDTKHVPISGGDVGGSKGFKEFKKEQVAKGMSLGLSEVESALLVQRYGSNVPVVFEYYQQKKDKTDLRPVTAATLYYSIDHEATCKPVDFFVRRTSALFFDIDWVKREKEAVIAEMKKILNWSNEQTERYTEELDELLYEAVHPVKS